MWDELCEVLLDLDFLQARMGVLTTEEQAYSLPIYDVLHDYLDALPALPSACGGREDVEMLYRALDRDAHILREESGRLLQQISDECDWKGTALEDPMQASARPLLRLLKAPMGATSSALLRVLSEHLGRTNVVAFSPNGYTLASGGHNGTVCVWDVASGAPLHRLKDDACPIPIRAVKFSPDGRTLVSVSQDGDGTVRFWETGSGAPLHTRTHPGGVDSVAFSPDIRTLAAAANDKTVRLWNVESGAPLHILQGHTKGVLSAPVSLKSKYDLFALNVWRQTGGRNGD
jgi:WD40 repeat protein